MRATVLVAIDLNKIRCPSFLILLAAFVFLLAPASARPVRALDMGVQGGWGGWPTGNGKKLSYSQACCLAQLCLAAA